MNKTIDQHSSTSSIKNNGHQLNLYKQTFKKTQKSKKSRSSFDTSLPFISLFSDGVKNVKVNAIRKQSEDAQQQIILMKARLHALKQMKNKVEFKKQKSLQKIQFVHTVRQRKNFESMQKLKEKERQIRQVEELKQKAKQLREGMRRQISKARQTLYMKNMMMAYQKKAQQVGFSDQIVKKQQMQLHQKLQKIERIKEQQIKHNEVLKQFQESRIKQAQKNHLSKAEKQYMQKQKRKKNLQKLRQQHEKCLQELKTAEKEYEQIIQLNPQGQFIQKGSRVTLVSKRN